MTKTGHRDLQYIRLQVQKQKVRHPLVLRFVSSLAKLPFPTQPSIL